MTEEQIVVRKKHHQLTAQGMHHGRLIEVKNYGLVADFRGERKLRGAFVWELQDEQDAEGKPLVIYESFNLSIEKKSRLRQILTEILGTEPNDEIVLNDLEGTECNLVVKHRRSDKDGEMYANIEGHFPLAVKSATTKAKTAGASGASEVFVARESKRETRTQKPHDPTLTDEEISY
jgi:hypothetical protein